MAKPNYSVGDEVHLRRNIEFGNIQIRKTTKGKILSVDSGMFKATKYEVEWSNPRVKITHVEGDLDFSRTM